METVKITSAALLVLFAFIVWFAFIRPVPEKSAQGRITQKLYKPADTYSLQHPGTDRGFRMPTNIPIAEAYVLVIQLDGVAEPVAAVLNMVESKEFEVGQPVNVKFIRRGLPPFWQRITVTAVRPHDLP